MAPASLTTTTLEASSRLDVPEGASASFEGDHFFWAYTEEPHRTRRQAIIKAHPEVGNGSLKPKLQWS